jgi:DNA-binding NtrC family response regulator
VPHRFGGWPVRSLRVAVIEGPDKGKTAASEGETLSIGTAQDNDLVLTDPTVSRYHLELHCKSDQIIVADQGSTNGTLAGKVRLERGIIVPGTQLELGKTTVRVDEGSGGVVELHEGESLGPLRGKSAAMRRVMALVEKASKADTAVLLVGESGTGKELIARAIHDASPRAEQPFITVDCGSLSPTLISSELFGHEKGAFTGADAAHAGAFERANGGTLFLDELGELPQALQPALLGVLERRSFRRLGGKKEISVDVQVVSATNRDLRAEVNAGRFRLDLYFRVAVLRIEVPSLRDHREDIPVLVKSFLTELGAPADAGMLLSESRLKELMEHRWPGNVRELKNFVEASVALGEAAQIERAMGDERHAALTDVAFEKLRGLPYKEARRVVVDEFERRYIAALLEQTHGNATAAAKIAAMDRSHFFELLKRHKLRES